jgi:hypothetical protein
MNFYASSVALLWTTAMRLGGARTEVCETDASERNAASARRMCEEAARCRRRRPGVRASDAYRLTCKCE